MRFKDLHGREWEPRITVGTVRRIRSALGIDIYKMVGNDDGIANFFADIVLVVDSLYLACESQAKEYGVTSEQFGEGLAGDAAEQAMEAFQQAILDFFPNSTVRNALRNLTVKEKQLRQAMAERGGQAGAIQLEKVLQVLTSKSPEELAAMPAEGLKKLFLSSRGSAESIPPTGPPENCPGQPGDD